jgi:hypothetical protein
MDEPKKEHVTSLKLEKVKTTVPKSLIRLQEFLNGKYFQHKNCEVFRIGIDSEICLEPVDPGRYDRKIRFSNYEKKSLFHTFCPECSRRIDLHSVLSSESIQIALGGYLPDRDEKRRYLIQNFFWLLRHRSEINAVEWRSQLTADRLAGELEVSNQFLKCLHQVIMCSPEDTDFYLNKLERLRGGEGV